MTQEEKQKLKDEILHEVHTIVTHTEPSQKTLVLYNSLKDDVSTLSINFALVKRDLDSHVNNEDSTLKHVAEDIRSLKESMLQLMPMYEQAKNSRIFINELKRRTGATFKWVTWVTGIAAFIFLIKTWIKQ